MAMRKGSVLNIVGFKGEEFIEEQSNGLALGVINLVLNLF